jgi:DNA-binding LacI/PurR family transcriptional regulator
MASSDRQTRKVTARPTIKTLAGMSGYSIATVSKALRGSPVVTEATRSCIRKLAREIGYQVNSRGLALRTGKTQQAAVLMPVTTATDYEWDGVEYTQILQGISHALENSGYRIALHAVRSVEEGFDTARKIAEMGLADGLLFSGIRADDPRIDYLVARDFPFVSLGRCRKKLVYAHVDADHAYAARAATARLLDGGHRRIALINPAKALSYAQDRRDGFRAAFREAGVRPSMDLVAEGDLSALFGMRTAERLSTVRDPATGFVCVNESTALGVIAGLNRLGRKIGRDVSVIAFDDINVSGYFNPPLTTLYHPIEQQGRKLGEFLLRRIAGEAPERLVHVFRPELIIRQNDQLKKNQEGRP